MAKTGKGVTLGDLSDGRAHNEVKWNPGAGHNSRGIESVIAPRQANREGLPPLPANPGERIDSTIPAPNTKHVKSNTTKGPERFHAGSSDTTGLNETRPMNPTMERPLTGKEQTPDSPVPIYGRQLPHPDLMTKAEESRFAEVSIGNTFPSGGVLTDRDDKKF